MLTVPVLCDDLRLQAGRPAVPGTKEEAKVGADGHIPWSRLLRGVRPRRRRGHPRQLPTTSTGPPTPIHGGAVVRRAHGHDAVTSFFPRLSARPWRWTSSPRSRSPPTRTPSSPLCGSGARARSTGRAVDMNLHHYFRFPGEIAFYRGIRGRGADRGRPRAAVAQAVPRRSPKNVNIFPQASIVASGRYMGVW